MHIWMIARITSAENQGYRVQHAGGEQNIAELIGSLRWACDHLRMGNMKY